MRSPLVTLAMLAATGCAARAAAPVAPAVASAVRCEVVFVEDASNESVEVLIPSRSLLVHHQLSADEAENFHAWSARSVHGATAPDILAWLIPSEAGAEAPRDDALWQQETRTMDWVLPSGAGKALQLFVNETAGAPPSLLVDLAPIGAPDARVCVARQGRGI